MFFFIYLIIVKAFVYLADNYQLYNFLIILSPGRYYKLLKMMFTYKQQLSAFVGGAPYFRYAYRLHNSTTDRTPLPKYK